jgi:serine/threonine-protein kinase/endoribonuclease IRE1
MQNISFSAYGPNNLDATLQSTYHRTLDDVYIQSLPNGIVVSLQAVAEDNPDPSPFLWHHEFNDPM